MLSQGYQMNESELRPRVFVAELIQPGDIVLTTTPEPMSQTIRKITGASDCINDRYTGRFGHVYARHY